MSKKLATILTPIGYGLYPALIIFLTTDKYLSHINKILLGFIVVAAKEVFTWIGLNIYLGPKKIFKLYKVIKTKPGMVSAIAGVVGGPIGYILLTISSFYVGSTISSLLMCLNAPLSALLEVLLLKRKKSFNMIFASILSLTGSILVVLTNANNITFNNNFYIGIILIFFVILVWSFESIIIDKYINNDEVIDEQTTITLKLTSSVIILLFVLLPVMSQLTTNNLFTGIMSLKFYFIDTNLLIPITLLGITMLIARMSYIYSVRHSSSTITTIIYNLSVLVTPILILVFDYFFKLSHKGDVKIIYSWSFWIALILMICGSILSNINRKFKNSAH